MHLAPPTSADNSSERRQHLAGSTPMHPMTDVALGKSLRASISEAILNMDNKGNGGDVGEPAEDIAEDGVAAIVQRLHRLKLHVLRGPSTES